MCAMARGETLEEFGKRPGVFSIINTNTPLQYDVPMTIGVMDMARYGQPVLLTPFVMAGASTPATIASAMALTNAEILFGVTLAQLVRPGAPVLYGCASMNVDMKTGAPAYGLADMHRCTIIGGQMARRYGLPLRSSNFSASNIADFASGYESANASFAAMHAGANLLMHAAGWVEGGLCTSYEKFVLDCEIVQILAQMLRARHLNADTLALDEIADVGPGGHFFGTDRTIATFETAFYRPLVSTTQNYGAWMEAGARRHRARHRIWQEALADLYRADHRSGHPRGAGGLRGQAQGTRRRTARLRTSNMSEQFPALFKPLQLRHKTLRNRIVFGSHTANMSDMGMPGERHRGYYEERARGGAAMIVVEPVPVHRTAVLTRGNFRHSTDEIIPHFRKITDAVHDHGAVICHQLYHVGQHGDFDNSYEPNWSPSGLPSFHDSDGSHAMNENEIEEIIESFVQAARRAKESGFDGIELFAAYNAIIDQFWLPFNNRRDDSWGGSFENRMRFSRTIMERIRKMAGEDFIIGLAVNMDPTSRSPNPSSSCRKSSPGTMSASSWTTSPAAPAATSPSAASFRTCSLPTSWAHHMPRR